DRDAAFAAAFASAAAAAVQRQREYRRARDQCEPFQASHENRLSHGGAARQELRPVTESSQAPSRALPSLSSQERVNNEKFICPVGGSPCGRSRTRSRCQ